MPTTECFRIWVQTEPQREALLAALDDPEDRSVWAQRIRVGRPPEWELRPDEAPGDPASV